MTRTCAYCGRQGVRAFEKVQLAGTRTGFVCAGSRACARRRRRWVGRFATGSNPAPAPFEQLSIR